MKTTKLKKAMAFALCLCMVMGAAGCSKTEKDKSKDKEKDKENVPASASADISDYEERIEKLENRLNLLTNFLGDGEYTGDDFWNELEEYGIVGEVHDIYDDTAVVEAFKSKDDSKLTDEKDKYIYDSLVKAVDEIIEDDMTDFEKEKAVYDYIFSGTRFDESSLAAIAEDNDEYSHTPYGFFHDHTTICVGNATTFKLFMDVLGIECEIIHSTESGEHAWNIVKIGDNWYHCDITFDGGSEEPDYAYFNVPDSAKADGGYPWNPEDYHECASLEYCYIFMNATEIKNVYDIPKAISDGLKDNKKAIYMKMPVGDELDYTIAKAQIMSILFNLNPNSEEGYSYCPYVMLADGYLMFTYCTDDSADTSIDDGEDDEAENGLEIDYDKLSEAFKKDMPDYLYEPDENWSEYMSDFETYNTDF